MTVVLRLIQYFYTVMVCQQIKTCKYYTLRFINTKNFCLFRQFAGVFLQFGRRFCKLDTTCGNGLHRSTLHKGGINYGYPDTQDTDKEDTTNGQRADNGADLFGENYDESQRAVISEKLYLFVGLFRVLIAVKHKNNENKNKDLKRCCVLLLFNSDFSLFTDPYVQNTLI